MASIVFNFLQSDSSAAVPAVFGAGFMIVVLAILVVVIVGHWKLFEKAHQPGWAILIPIYNLYVLTQIVGRPAWWVILCFVPLVNIVILAIISIDLAKSFGKDAVWGIILCFLLNGIGQLILGFGSAQYLGPSAAPNTMAARASA